MTAQTVSATQAAARIALTYLIVATAWIVASDVLLILLMQDPQARAGAELAKGVGFVIVTALLLYFVVLRPLSRIEAARDEAAAAAARDRALFAANPHPMWVYDLETLNFVAVNDAAVAKYGYSAEEFLAMTIADIRPPEDVTALRENVARVGEGLDAAGAWRHRCRDGTELEVEITSHTLVWEGRRAEVVLAHDVTERQRTQRQLARSEARLRLALAATAQGLYDLDLRSGAAEVNDEYARMLGYEPAQFRETNAAWIERLHPDDRERVAAIYRAYVAGELPEYRVEFRQRTRTGQWKWILSLGAIVERAPDGAPLRMLGTHTDISGEVAARERVARLSQLYAALSHTNKAILRATALTPLLEEVCRIACSEGGLRMAWIGLADAPSRLLVPAAQDGVPAGYADLLTVSLDPHSPFGAGPASIAMRTGRHCISNDLAHDPVTLPWRAAATQAGLLAAAGYPLRRGGEVVGALTLYADQPGAFDTEMVELLDEMAADISAALDTFALRETREREATALQESEARFRDLLASLDDVVWSARLEDGRMLYINAAAEGVYGVSLQRFFDDPQQWLNAVHPDDLSRVRMASARLFDEGHAEATYRIVRPDGTVRWLLDRKRVIEDAQGRRARIGGVAVDITSQVEAEHAIAHAKQLLQGVIDSSPDWIFAKDSEHRFLLVNRAFATAHGLRPADMTGRMDSEFWPQVERGARDDARSLRGVRDDERRVLAGEVVHLANDSATLADGSARSFDTVKAPLRGADGSVQGVLAYARDITERRDAEQRIARSEQNLRVTLESIGDAVISTDDAGRIVLMNPVAEVLTGWTAAQARGRALGEVFRIVDEQTGAARESPVDKVLREGRVVGLASHTVLLARDGTARPIADSGSPIRMRGDSPILGVVLVFRDQTEERTRLDALEASETRFRATFEQAAVGLAHVAPNGHWLRVNRTLCEIVGYTHDELMASSFQDITHPDDLDADLDQVRRLLAAEIDQYAMEKRYLKRDGTIVWVRLTVALVRGADGAPDYFVSAVEDIGARKRLENEREQALRALRLQFEAMPIACIVADPDLTIRDCNPAAEALFGHTREAVAGRCGFDLLVPPATRATVRARLDDMLRGRRPQRGLNENLTRDGRLITCEWANTPVLDQDGHPVAILAMAQDVSARVAAEQALRENEQRYRYLFAESPVPLFEIDAGTLKILDANAAAVDHYGYTHEEFSGMPLAELRPPEEVARMTAFFAGEQPRGLFKGVWRHRRKDGSLMDVAIYARDLTYGGRSVRLALAQDVTDQRRVEAALRESEARYRVVFEQAGQGIARVAPDGRYLEVNGAFCRIVGRTRRELLDTSVFEITDAADVDTERLWFAALLSGSADHYTLDKRSRRRDGTPVWASMSRRLVCDGSGAPLYFITVITDVSERHAAQEALRASEAQYRTLTRVAPVGIFRADSERRCVFVNERWSIIAGLDAERARGTGWAQTVHEHDRERVLALWEGAGASDEARFKAEYRVVRPDGDIRWVIAEAAEERDDAGQRLGYVGCITDITERKAAEERLAHLSRRLLAVQEEERRALARELHDAIGQRLAALKLNYEVIRRAGVAPAAAQRLADCSVITDETITQIRATALDLRPTMLDDLGLDAALHWYARDQAERAACRIDASAVGLPRVAAHIETAVFRIAQEAVNNSIRHGRAGTVRIAARLRQGRLEIEISDDGQGFDTGATGAPDERGGLGLLGMRERAELLGGRLEIESAPGAGTTVRATIPL